MFDFLIITLLYWAVGCSAALSAYYLFKSNNNFFLPVGAIASISCYVFIILANNDHPLFIIIFVQLLIGILLSIFIIQLSSYISSFEFILVSLAFIEIVNRLQFHFDSITGGADGMNLTNPYYYGKSFKLISILAVIAIILLVFLHNRSKNGKKIEITGNTSLGAQNMGINVKKIIIYSSVITGSLSSVSGLIYGLGYGYIHPDDLSTNIGLYAIAVAISLKGKYFVPKLLTLTFLLFAFKEILRLINIESTLRFGIFDIVSGIIIIIISIILANKNWKKT